MNMLTNLDSDVLASIIEYVATAKDLSNLLLLNHQMNVSVVVFLIKTIQNHHKNLPRCHWVHRHNPDFSRNYEWLWIPETYDSINPIPIKNHLMTLYKLVEYVQQPLQFDIIRGRIYYFSERDDDSSSECSTNSIDLFDSTGITSDKHQLWTAAGMDEHRGMSVIDGTHDRTPGFAVSNRVLVSGKKHYVKFHWGNVCLSENNLVGIGRPLPYDHDLLFSSFDQVEDTDEIHPEVTVNGNLFMRRLLSRVGLDADGTINTVLWSDKQRVVKQYRGGRTATTTNVNTRFNEAYDDEIRGSAGIHYIRGINYFGYCRLELDLTDLHNGKLNVVDDWDNIVEELASGLRSEYVWMVKMEGKVDDDEGNEGVNFDEYDPEYFDQDDHDFDHGVYVHIE